MIFKCLKYLILIVFLSFLADFHIVLADADCPELRLKITEESIQWIESSINSRFKNLKVSIDKNYSTHHYLKSDEQNIGGILLRNYHKVDDAIVIRIVEVNRDHRGIGLGSYLYLAIARYYFSKHGKILYRSTATNELSDSVWKRFLENGVAEEVIISGKTEIRFKSAVLRSHALEKLDYLYE